MTRARSRRRGFDAGRAVGALAAGIALSLSSIAIGSEPRIITRDVRSPEGPIYVDDTLYLVDYVGHDVVRIQDSSAKVVWHRDGCGPTGLARVPEGLLVACFDGRQIVTISLEGKTLSTVENDEGGQRLREPNDFVRDAKGGVYVSGTGPWEPRPIVGKIYYRSADRKLRTVASDLHSPNGLVLSLDGKLLYVAESFASRILLFDVASDGSLSGRREFLKISEVLPAAATRTYTPDGVRIDRNGNLFVGFWDGACFAVISPDGKLIKQIDLPATHDPNLAITPDGRNVVSTGVFDTPNGGSRGELYLIPNPVPPQ
jgi:gluconolactonase